MKTHFQTNTSRKINIWLRRQLISTRTSEWAPGRHSAPEETKSLHFGRIYWIQRNLKSAPSNPAKVLLIMSQHRHFVMSLHWNLTTASVKRKATHNIKEASGPKNSSMSLRAWTTWKTHFQTNMSGRINIQLRLQLIGLCWEDSVGEA